MKGNLLSRVDLLEAQQRGSASRRCHRILQQARASEAMARERYQRDFGIEIDPADLVILRVIVGPSEGMAA